MRVLIVDDERPARDRLRRLLSQESGIQAIDEAGDGVEALERIAQFKPDALFLDIQMPELTGIELANAIDYLLKPCDGARLGRAVQRLRERLDAAPRAPQSTPALPVRQLLVSERGGTRIVRVEDIQWIETADNYVALHTAQGAPLLRQTLGGLLASLGAGFVRCHRRAAVRLDWIERVVPLDKGDCELVLRGGVRVPCSRQYRAAVVEKL
jgi:two-component system LytT family response regulator